MALHAIVLALFLAVSRMAYGPGEFPDAGVLLWVLLAGWVAGAAARITGPLWLYSAAAAGLACAATPLVRTWWEPTTRATFWLVRSMLSPLLRDLVVEPGKLRIGTPDFQVTISPECSGLEGLGLLLVFGIVWLVLFRDELRFPQALTLLPLGMAVLYLSNSVRIAALVLIGNAGLARYRRPGLSFTGRLDCVQRGGLRAVDGGAAVSLGFKSGGGEGRV